MRDLKQTARTREQSVQTAKLLYRLADSAVRLSVEKALSVPIQEQCEDIDIILNPNRVWSSGNAIPSASQRNTLKITN